MLEDQVPSMVNPSGKPPERLQSETKIGIGLDMHDTKGAWPRAAKKGIPRPDAAVS